MATKRKKKKATSVYIGRSLPGLQQYTVFPDGKLPGHIAEMAAQNEAVAGLIVPVDELAEARKNVRVKGHILNLYASKLIR